MKTEKEIKAELKRLEEWFKNLTPRERMELNEVHHTRINMLNWVLGKEDK